MGPVVVTSCFARSSLLWEQDDAPASRRWSRAEYMELQASVLPVDHCHSARSKCEGPQFSTKSSATSSTDTRSSHVVLVVPNTLVRRLAMKQRCHCTRLPSTTAHGVGVELGHSASTSKLGVDLGVRFQPCDLESLPSCGRSCDGSPLPSPSVASAIVPTCGIAEEVRRHHPQQDSFPLRVETCPRAATAVGQVGASNPMSQPSSQVYWIRQRLSTQSGITLNVIGCTSRM